MTRHNLVSHCKRFFRSECNTDFERRSRRQWGRVKSVLTTDGDLMYGSRLQLLVVLTGLVASVLQVSGIKMYTSGELEAVNGTDVRLKCSFQTTEPINPSSLTVSWIFRPLGVGQDETVLYYHEKSYPTHSGRFHKRVEWLGDIMRKDATIMLRDVKASDNGTFSCRVMNPPDVHGPAGDVRLRVVTSVSYSEMTILAAAIGGGILLMLVILIIVIAVKHYRQKRQGIEEECPTWQKEPTVW